MKTQTAVLLGVGGVLLYLVLKNKAAAATATVPAPTYCTGPGTPASAGLCTALNALGVQPWCASAGSANVSICL